MSLRPGGLDRPDLLRRAPVFVVVGVAWTVLYLILFAVLRLLLPDLSAQLANVVALVLTTVGATAGHRRWTFGAAPGPVPVQAGRQLLGLVLLAVGLGLTSGSLALLQRRAPDAALAVEVGVLLTVTGFVGMVRFVVLAVAMPPADLSARR